MKKSLLFLLPAVFAFNITNVSALEIDEKLTLRFLKVSSTKKTVLINRGGEDGLVVGDHAKFFITAGVVARGVAEKVSPSRSVWSLYRIVDPNEITQDKVLNLKIATPVKITDDPSRSLKEEVIPGGNEKMDVAPGTEGEATSDDADQVMNDADKNEMKDLGMNEDGADDEISTIKAKPKKKEKEKEVKEVKVVSGRKSVSKRNTSVSDESSSASSYQTNNTSRTWEVWGAAGFNSLSASVSEDSTTTTGTAKSGLDLTGSIEKYFLKSNGFLKDLSFNIFIHKTTLDQGSTDKTSTDIFEYGVAANYHIINPPSAISAPIGFLTASVGKGNATENITPEVGDSSTAKGTTTFFTVGGGVKYNFANGFGLRGAVEYYRSSHEFVFDDGTTTAVFTGPKVSFGLAYRF